MACFSRALEELVADLSVDELVDLFASPNYRQFRLGSLRYLSGGGAAMP